MKVKRFYYVTAPFGSFTHRLYGKRVEGEKTACGLTLTTSWHWGHDRPRALPRCKKCEHAEIA